MNNRINTMIRFFQLITCSLLLLTITACNSPIANVAETKPHIKYVFLFIGDGMGVNHRQLAEVANQRGGRPGLLMNQFPFQATTHTMNAASQVTDSAAAGTAIACGVKTANGRLGIDNSGMPVKSIAAQAQTRGMKIGIISSTSLNDATPAAFYAHVGTRGSFHDITQQMADSGFNFFGGGRLALSSGDAKNYYEAAFREKGYSIGYGYSALAVANDKSVALSDNLFVIDERPDSDRPTLSEYTTKAIACLDNPAGFFIMVEGAKIDHASHANDTGTMLRELYVFDAAITVAENFRLKHPEETLIVVTSDHETGGLTFKDSQILHQSELHSMLQQAGSYNMILTEIKKAGASGISAELAMVMLKRMLNFSTISPQDENSLTTIWQSQASDKYAQFTAHAFKLRDEYFGLKWTSVGHTGAAVITSTAGRDAAKFVGEYENTQIYFKLKQLMVE